MTGYETYREALNGELAAAFSGRQGFLYDLLRYHLGWTDEHGQPSGEIPPIHLPGVLGLTACRAVSGEFTPALPVAAGVELVHNFTLVHGEVQAGRLDSQDRPSIWWVWGPAQAINAGDGLHALGRVAVMKLAERGIDAAAALDAVRRLDRACLALCEGQFLDLTFRDQVMVTTGDYIGMAARKTGALASCAAQLGAMAGGATGKEAAHFERAGECIGIAWQIVRDIEDSWGRGGDGMTPSNIVNKKKSLPLIHAMDTASPGEKRQLGSIYTKRVLEPEDVAQVTAVLDSVGSREFATTTAAGLVDEAVAELIGLHRFPGAADAFREVGTDVLRGGL